MIRINLVTNVDLLEPVTSSQNPVAGEKERMILLSVQGSPSLCTLGLFSSCLRPDLLGN